MNAIPSFNFGQHADDIYAKVQEIAIKAAEMKELDVEKRNLENDLLAAMLDAGTTIVRGKTATVSTSTTVRPQISDFDAFAAFVVRKKAVHLFERRVAAAAYKEMKESLGGKDIPGLTEFEQTRLNCRKV